MAKSFIPQFIKLLNRLAVYITRHQGTMELYLSPAQVTCLNNLAATITTCSAAFGVYHEVP